MLRDWKLAQIFATVRHANVILTPDLQSLGCTEDMDCSEPASGSGVSRVDKSMAVLHIRARSEGVREIKFQSAPRKSISRLAVAFAALLSIAVPVTQASAQELSLIRDAETEALIADYTMPIFRAAGVSSNNIKVHLVNDTSFNAFVVDGRNMFINTGAILLSETPNQLIGVIAHETGHITGGHITGLRSRSRKCKRRRSCFRS